MDPGPSDGSVLTRQAEHRSTWIWDGPDEGELWAFARFPHMVPKMKEPLQGALDPELPLGPHAIRYILLYPYCVTILVNTQLRMLSRCQPNSENYKDIMDVLDVVGEMNRVNLDSARAVSSTRTPVAGHGRRSGGRGGRRGGRGFGRGSSHDQEHSDSDEYPPSAVDIDSDSDYGLSIDDIGIRPCMIHHDIGPSTTHDTPPSPLPTTLHDDIGPSYTHDASSSPLPLTPNDDIEPSTTHGAPWFPLPSTPMSATLTTNVASTDLAGGSSRVFIPILGLPTPHHHFPTRSTQIHSLPKPQQEVARVEQPHGKNVEQLEPPPPKYLKCTRNEKSSCGTGEGRNCTGDTTDCALACPSNSLPTQLTTTSIAEQNPSSLLVQQQVPTLTWPKNSELDVDWIENLISIFDWSSKNLPASEFPLVLPVQAFDTLILTASKILHKEPNCITINPVESSSVVVVGDIHGQLHDLIFLLKHAGFPSQNRFFVFNGDYVDRGAWGLETFLLLLAWKVFMPDRVFLLRGNHESKYCTSNYGFDKEVLTKYGDSGKHVYRKCLGCFEELPLASIIAGCVYTAHGGLFRSIPLVPSKRSKRKKRRRVSLNSEPKSLSLGSLEELSGARRSVLDPPWEGLNLIPGDVLWSDPSMTPGLSLNKERGIGLLWGPDCTEDFLKKFNLKLIIRSHEGPHAREKRTGFGGMDEGYTIDHVVESGKLITVFSAPDYPQFQVSIGSSFLRFVAAMMFFVLISI
ncbi:serine/threonine-protein phosphatase 7 [Quercus suber]|uniref:Serine/threonine-protein phosphatase n=1 Tax=Quercus suber TaxID=58331 RepID=A0AAW0KU79_QUESU